MQNIASGVMTRPIETDCPHAGLRAVLRRALAPEREDRYADAEQMAHALAAALADEVRPSVTVLAAVVKDGAAEDLAASVPDDETRSTVVERSTQGRR
jgi:hypothetical protein